MNIKARADMVRAMDLIARSINDEEIMMTWLTYGVADGDIKEDTTDEDLEHYYEDDEDFADLMDTFLYLMHRAMKDGLYVDKVLSNPKV